MAKTSAAVEMPKMDPDWQAEDDHRCLMRAAEIMADSKRMAGAKRHASKVAGATAMLSHMLAAKKLGGRLARTPAPR